MCGCKIKHLVIVSASGCSDGMKSKVQTVMRTLEMTADPTVDASLSHV